MRTCRRPGRFAGFMVVGAALAGGDAGAVADTITVEVHHSSFMVTSMVPGQGTAHATIELGDVVRWVWMSNFHSATSDTGVFDSGVSSMPFQFEHTFSAEGEFPYHCVIHGGAGGVGMSGSITVAPAPGAALAVGVAGVLAARRRRR